MSKWRAPFIWSPRQPIAADVNIALRDKSPREDGKNRWFLFRTMLELGQVPATASTDITVDGRYLLFVNGQKVGRGPVRCSPLFQRFDTYDLAEHLRPGKNVVAALVHTYGVDTAFYEGAKGLWRPVLGEGGLWVEGEVVDTRRPWRCIQTTAWAADVPQANHSLGFIEWFDANEIPSDWVDLEFDDSAWDSARPLIAGGGGPESDRGGMTVEPFPILVPRGIPQLDETFVKAEAIRWIKGQVTDAELPIHRRLYEEALVPATDDVFQGAEQMLAGGEAVVRSGVGVDTAFLLDFGRILSGYPAFEIEAKGGEIIEIGCAERLAGEWTPDGMNADARIERRPYLGADAHLCRYVARPGVQRFERFEWCAIRYMHVVVRNAAAGLVVRRLGAVETHYPVEPQGSFACSDDLLTKLWAAGRYTLRQCMHDAWEDCPGREQRQWLGDVTIESLAAWAAFGDSAAPLTAKFLIQAAESQRADGLTQMFAPGDHGDNARLIPDWTLQWILCAADYWGLTGDAMTMNAIWPSIQKALRWFELVAGTHGLVVDMPYWHFMDWAGLGRDGQALALNAQLAGAYRAAARIGRALGYERAAETYDARATDILARLDEGHWDEERGVWVDSVLPSSALQGRRVSQHGVAALTLWGHPDAGRTARALDWATDPARETMTPAPPVVPFGSPLDEERGVVMANTFYGHFVCEALARHGRGATALAILRRRFGPMLDAGSTTLWEAITPWASLCHGFSASPTWFLTRHVLGVSAAEPGFERISFCPDLMGLDWAEGVVPAGQRRLTVSLKRTPGGFSAEIAGGEDVIEVYPPHGFEIGSVESTGQAVEVQFRHAR